MFDLQIDVFASDLIDQSRINHVLGASRQRQILVNITNVTCWQ